MTINFSSNSNSSDPSDPISSIRIPQVKNFTGYFGYNYYTEDESVNDKPTIPSFYRDKKVNELDAENISFTLRVPRFIKLNWEIPDFKSNEFNVQVRVSPTLIADNLKKIVNEGNFIGSKYISYIFSATDSLEDASADINNDGRIDLYSNNNLSQTGIIDNYVKKYLDFYKFAGGTESKKEEIKNKISKAIETLEKLGDRPNKTFGYRFADTTGKFFKDTTGFDQLLANSESLYTQLNAIVLPDLFAKTKLPRSTLNAFEKYYNNHKIPLTELEEFIQPFQIFDMPIDSNKLISTKYLVGYTIDKYEQIGQDLIKIETIPIENFEVGSIVDVNVKYNTIYHYVIRTVCQIVIPAYFQNFNELRYVGFLIASNPVALKVISEKDTLPPEPPSQIDFSWDYRKKRLKISWNYPVSAQRDVGQFQVFRRRNIYEPFELIHQRHFDKSVVKYPTGEIIDGNIANANQYSNYVSLDDYPHTFSYDDDFKLDIDTLTVSKYIYSIAVIDTHGVISNYSAQFEVSFDFFKNKLTKKLISRAGAPRPYPNLKLSSDLYKDSINPGKTSKQLKIYFNPDYYKLIDRDKKIMNLVGTNQSKSYYKIQFINTQNQKTASLKINIDDQKNLANDNSLLILNES